MGAPTVPPAQPALLVLPAFSRYGEALDWAREKAAAHWGVAALESPRFPFEETAYYRATMGEGLRLQIFAFAPPIDAADLPDIKRRTIAWEAEYRDAASVPEPRPLNLDPGYLTEAKLVLATTKDRDHRLYLRDGIFAEITLTFQHGRWLSHPWTYPNYRRADYQQFFLECRRRLRHFLGKK